MKNRILPKLNLAKKALLAFTGIAAVVIVLVSASRPVNASQVRAQSKPTESLRFEVTSVRPHPPGGAVGNGLAGQFLPSGEIQIDCAIVDVDAQAYKLPPSEIMRTRTPELSSSRLWGLPDWARTDSVYDIEATGVIPDGLSTPARNDRMLLMLQTLLADRFKLALHHEMKEMPVYALVVGKGGSKLQKAEISEKDCPDADAPSYSVYVGCHVLNGDWEIGLHGRAVTMTDLVNFVRADRPLVDKTGIKGLYHIETTGWLPMEPGPPPSPGAKSRYGTVISDLPTIFDVFEKLGLKMEPQRDKVDVIVVDHIERANRELVTSMNVTQFPLNRNPRK